MRTIVTLAALIACGCDVLPTQTAGNWFGPRLANRNAIARFLPEGVRLDTPLHCFRPEFTVEDELIRVGARIDADGKLVSAAGKEIYFEHVSSGGPVLPTPTPEQRAAAAEERRRLEERYTIITVVFLGC
jgi:hypothetical protein